MATTRDWAAHADVVSRAADDLARRARQAGLDAPVPTCPRWSVADLVAHQGIVHRWAVSHLAGPAPASTPKARLLREVPQDRLVGWFEEGAQLLLRTLASVADDVEAEVFLRDAPAPRTFWARRQAHETTIHSVDALAAVLGRVPRSDEVDLDPAVAVDGIDELLLGFVTRGRSKLARQDGTVLRVVPERSDTSWELRLGERIETRAVPPGGGGGVDPAAVEFRGSAQDLYLGLWNRGEEIRASDPGLLADWHGRQRVRWS